MLIRSVPRLKMWWLPLTRLSVQPNASSTRRASAQGHGVGVLGHPPAHLIAVHTSRIARALSPRATQAQRALSVDPVLSLLAAPDVIGSVTQPTPSGRRLSAATRTMQIGES